MRSRLPLLVLAVWAVGCSGEPAPTVGDAEISKGIATKPMPQIPDKSATSGLSARDLAKIRQGQ